MLATTGLVALGRKLSDDKARRKEVKQSELQIGDIEVARRAFASQTIAPQGHSVTRTGTEIKWENAGDIGAGESSPVSPESTQNSPLSPTARAESARASISTSSEQLPPYSPAMDSIASLPSRRAPSLSPSTTLASDRTSTLSSSSAGSASSTIRVKTHGSDLSSGFPYHPSLYDLRVRPDDWTRFSSEICLSTKLTSAENAKLWASATTVALTGAIVTSVWLGRNMKRTMQETKVRQGLQDLGEGGLGETLQIWNEDYFGKLGLVVHLELSAEAVKHGGASKTVRKHSMLYSSRKERDRKREERNFVLVVSSLDGGFAKHAGEVCELPASDAALRCPCKQKHELL